jgi:hypothetical protein
MEKQSNIVSSGLIYFMKKVGKWGERGVYIFDKK